jgi:hypothetical protein
VRQGAVNFKVRGCRLLLIVDVLDVEGSEMAAGFENILGHML